MGLQGDMSGEPPGDPKLPWESKSLAGDTGLQMVVAHVQSHRSGKKHSGT